MKNIFLLIILFLATTVFGQTKDRRAELEVTGRVEEISVSPDGKIWLTTAVGKTYYCDDIDSNWHYGKPIYFSKDMFYNFAPTLERISFFNKDTAIITGYISFDEDGLEKNGYYYTKDAGATWELRNYGGDSWIYSIYTDKSGNAWMGGLYEELYYSNDFGITWKTKKLPYKLSDRTYGIFMCDSQNGIASSDANEILMIDFTAASIVPLLVSAATGTVLSILFLGKGVMLEITTIVPFSTSNVLFYIILGIFTAGVSIYFLRISRFVEKWIHKIKPKYLKGIIGSILLGLLIFLFPVFYGEGYESIPYLVSGQTTFLFKNSPIFHYFAHFDSNFLFIIYLGLIILIKVFPV
jgi:hypothetical protein